MAGQHVSEWISRRLAPTEAAPSAEPAGPERETLGSIIQAQLLLELPEHHRDCTSAWETDNLDELRRCVHKLAGAVAYCDLPDLSASLAGLRQALQSQDRERLRSAYLATSRSMTTLMKTTGTD